MDMNGISWGAVPDWLEAVGTVGALLLTYLLLRHELAAWRADRREQERHREEARRAQAGAVASWIEAEDDGQRRPGLDCLRVQREHVEARGCAAETKQAITELGKSIKAAKEVTFTADADGISGIISGHACPGDVIRITGDGFGDKQPSTVEVR